MFFLNTTEENLWEKNKKHLGMVKEEIQFIFDKKVDISLLCSPFLETKWPNFGDI